MLLSISTKALNLAINWTFKSIRHCHSYVTSPESRASFWSYQQLGPIETCENQTKFHKKALICLLPYLQPRNYQLGTCTQPSAKWQEIDSLPISLISWQQWLSNNRQPLEIYLWRCYLQSPRWIEESFMHTSRHNAMHELKCIFSRLSNSP